jgi:hypothetical protein
MPNNVQDLIRWAGHVATHGLTDDTMEEERKERLRKAAAKRAKVKHGSGNVSVSTQLEKLEKE